MTYINDKYIKDSEENIKTALDKIVSEKLAANIFEHVCAFGYMKTIKLMLQNPKFNSVIKNSAPAILAAFSQGYDEIAEYILNDPRVDRTHDNNIFIGIAVELDNLNLLKFLMNDPKTDPSDDNNYALLYAAEYDLTDTIKQLLTDKRVNPSVDDNTPLRYAATIHYNYEITKLYLKYPSVLKSLTPSLADLEIIRKALKELYNVSSNTIEQLSNLF